MTTVHLFSPHVLDCRLGRGGTSAFRSVATVAQRFGPVVCYQPPSRSNCLLGQGGFTVATGSMPDLLTELGRRAKPGDLLIKCSGAGHEHDHELDDALVESRRRRGFRAVYLDADAPSRLPLLPRPFYLDDLLPEFDAVVLLAGGRAAQEDYQRRGARKVCHIDPAVTVFHHEPRPVGAPDSRVFDLAVTVGAASERETRIRDWLRSIDRRHKIVIVGDWPFPASADDGWTILPAMDPVALQHLYAASRFTLNLLRRDVRGYPRVPPVRLFEAALAGSCVLTERYPELHQDLVPGTGCVEVTEPRDVDDALSLPERRRRMIAREGRRHVLRQTRRAADTLTRVLADVLATPSPSGPVPPRDDRRPVHRRLCHNGQTVVTVAGVSVADRERVHRVLGSAHVVELADLRQLPALRPAVVVAPAARKHDVDAVTHDHSPQAVIVTGDTAETHLRLRWIAGRDWRLADLDRNTRGG